MGLSLVSAILFSGAAICLRGEKEQEETINMQYLMPGKTKPSIYEIKLVSSVVLKLYLKLLRRKIIYSLVYDIYTSKSDHHFNI